MGKKSIETLVGVFVLLGIGFATFVEPSPGPPDYTQALGAGAAPRSAQRATARCT